MYLKAKNPSIYVIKKKLPSIKLLNIIISLMPQMSVVSQQKPLWNFASKPWNWDFEHLAELTKHEDDKRLQKLTQLRV